MYIYIYLLIIESNSRLSNPIISKLFVSVHNALTTRLHRDNLNICLCSGLLSIGHVSIELTQDILSTPICPILFYGCDVWGYENTDTFKILKFLIQIKSTTPINRKASGTRLLLQLVWFMGKLDDIH